jgi:hypothetical protein
MPLSERLAHHIHLSTDDPQGSQWESHVLHEDDMERAVSQWTGGGLGDVWKKLNNEDQRTQVFSFVALLAEGGIYADAHSAVRYLHIAEDSQ